MATVGITVLLSNARRQTIKVTPNTSILQIHEDVCKTQNLNPEEYDLVYQRKPLDLSLTVRFANLPNNVSLELLPTKFGPKTDQLVTVGLQLESGERLLTQFKPSDSLWNIIQHWDQKFKSEGKSLKVNSVGDPVCVYMRNEVVGEQNLKNTTLRRLGITSGKVVIRLNFRNPESLKEQAHSYDLQISKRTKVEPESIIVVDGDQKSSEIKPEKASSDDSDSNKNTETVSEIRDVESAVAVVHTPPPSPPDLINSPSAEAMDVTKSPIPEPRSSESKKTDSSSIVDIRNSVSNNPTQINNNENSEAMESSTEVSSPAEIVQEEEDYVEEKIIYLGARNALLFDLEQVPSFPQIDLPDEFYNLTVDEIRYLYSDLQRQRRQIEDQPLLLESQRQSKKATTSTRYKQAVLRIRFPDGYVLQAHFTPDETVSTVIEFLRQFLEDPKTDFHLYTTPPRSVLALTSTLFEAKLVPAALVHFGSNDQNKANFLSENVKASVSTLAAATKNAAVIRATSKDITNSNTIDTQMETNSTASTSTSRTLLRDQRGLDNVNSPRPQTKNVPKWFKLGK